MKAKKDKGRKKDSSEDEMETAEEEEVKGSPTVNTPKKTSQWLSGFGTVAGGMAKGVTSAASKVVKNTEKKSTGADDATLQKKGIPGKGQV